MRKFVLSLFILVTIIAMPPPAAWANSVVNWSAGGWVLNTSTSVAGNGYWNGLQVEFNGGSFLFGAASSNLWTFSASNSLILGAGPTSWHSTLGLTFLMFPYSTPFTVDVFQFENGALLAGESTELSWDGHTWTAQSTGLKPTPVPEPTTWALLGISVLTGGVLRKRFS